MIVNVATSKTEIKVLFLLKLPPLSV